VKDLNSKPPEQDDDAQGNGESANRRRLGRVVHDDRGCASVEWQDAPQNYVRPVFELEDGARTTTRLKALRDKAPLALAKKQDAFNPYQRSTPQPAAQGAGTRRDLRKLSKWIKLMREVEERKALDKEEAEKPRED
jgi:hypothetical protein